MDNVLFNVTGNNIISIVSLLAAIFALFKYFKRGVNWVDDMNGLTKKIEDLEKKHNDDIHSLKEEQTVLVYGVLACLKGLKEQGCNGPVTEAIATLEKHLNLEAHR